MPSDLSIPSVCITLGDPGGIGPEVVLKALADPARRAGARFIILGPAAALECAAALAGIEPFWTTLPAGLSGDEAFWRSHGPAPLLMDSCGGRPRECAPVFPAAPARESGAMSYQCVIDAIHLARLPAGDPRRVDAIVTGPISKKAWALAGHGQFPGHTELLAHAFGAPSCAMFFHAPAMQDRPGLNVALVTVHIPLSRVAASLTTSAIAQTIELTARAVARLGVHAPRIAVCGLNPHAGEEGLLGSEEEAIIAPAVAQARAAGHSAHGPFPADTIFQRALSLPGVRPPFDAVVAMYHDQGLAPLKTLAWDRAVNMTLGLPTVRTSPDHGTAFDIAGTNTANPGSMAAAIDLAVRCAAPGPVE
ncbi:MAG: 4-hydroxythreonine-4-phosphate dehydrogenase PdxA [Phycisphaeraceae bacterium]|nr:4-hydroxythreonine-4-phosphate dehydrogenase PdxA [Phycisphaeraceae bacterium]